MIAVVFEVEPAEGGRDRYLDLAAVLKPALERMHGFVSVERFQSLTNPGKLLSLSLWRGKAAVKAWRNTRAMAGCSGSGRATFSPAVACGSRA